jgi:hypothetical protein
MNHRRYLFLVVILALLVTPGREAAAAPTLQQYCVYYSDANYTTPVGDCWFTCSGVYCSGTKTQYKKCGPGQRCGTGPLLCSESPACEPILQDCCCEIYPELGPCP